MMTMPMPYSMRADPERLEKSESSSSESRDIKGTKKRVAMTVAMAFFIVEFSSIFMKWDVSTGNDSYDGPIIYYSNTVEFE